jgi:5,5'-dehydrodivanillate O-demethylase
MGPPPAPLLPLWDLFVWPNAIRQIAVNVLNCNWLQCQENTGDSTHSVWLHGHFFRYVLERAGQLEERGADLPQHTITGRVKTGIGINDMFARPNQYGFEKGIIYSKALGAERDGESRHSTVVFPFYTQTGRAGSPRSEFQIRVPTDDEHTYHICYQVYAAPPGIEAPNQDVIPWYEVPLTDECGKPILDHVLSQDILAWQAQGVITDRAEEQMGRTDKPIIPAASPAGGADRQGGRRRRADECLPRRGGDGRHPVRQRRSARTLALGSNSGDRQLPRPLSHGFRRGRRGSLRTGDTACG